MKNYHADIHYHKRQSLKQQNLEALEYEMTLEWSKKECRNSMKMLHEFR